MAHFDGWLGIAYNGVNVPLSFSHTRATPDKTLKK